MTSNDSEEKNHFDVIDEYIDILQSDGTDDEIKQRLDHFYETLTERQCQILNNLFRS